MNREALKPASDKFGEHLLGLFEAMIEMKWRALVGDKDFNKESARLLAIAAANTFTEQGSALTLMQNIDRTLEGAAGRLLEIGRKLQ